MINQKQKRIEPFLIDFTQILTDIHLNMSRNKLLIVTHNLPISNLMQRSGA